MLFPQLSRFTVVRATAAGIISKSKIIKRNSYNQIEMKRANDSGRIFTRLRTAKLLRSEINSGS